MAESNQNERNVVHSVPCTQNDNITWIKDSINDLWKVLDGNGSGKGMKIDLELTKEHVIAIKGIMADIQSKLSSVSEINTELEVQRRVALAIEAHDAKNKQSKQTNTGLTINRLSLIFAGIMLIASITIGIINLIHNKPVGSTKMEQTAKMP